MSHLVDSISNSSFPLVIIPKGQKGPRQKNWDRLRLTPAQIQRALDSGRNLGIILGPGSVVDIEVDGPEGEASLRKLFKGEPTLAPCWVSLRGKHRLYLYDDRFRGLGAKFTHPDYPGLEFRIGDGAAQSLIPPSEVDGFRRVWSVDISDMAPPPLPEAVIATIVALHAPKDAVVYGQTGWDAIDKVEGDVRTKIIARLQAWHDRYGAPGRFSNRKNAFVYTYCPLRGPKHRDGGAIMFVNADGSYVFNCKHNECSGKAFDDLQAAYGPFDPPIIKVDHDIDRMSEEALFALRGAENVFQRGVLVEVVQPAPQPSQCLADNGAPRLRPIPKPVLDTTMCRSAKWRKQSTRGGWVPASPPLRVVDSVLSVANPSGIQVVTGIVSSPVLRADGSILATPGYDRATGLYLDINGTFPPLMRVANAIKLLCDIVADFPFASREHRSAWLAAIITLLSRHAFAGCSPFFLFDGNASRVGKGLLTDLITIISEGRKASRCDYSENKEEMSKFLTSLIVAGRPYILFDNIKGKFGGKILEGMLTTGRWSARLLGGHETIDIPFTSVCLGTANNATLTTDMVGRTCHCRLETTLERPGERTDFVHDDLPGFVRENRRALAIAALSIPAAYIKAGRPDQHLSGWGGFSEWSDLVRSSLVWAGEPDPDTRLRLAEQSDDETATLSLLMDGWAELDRPMSVSEAVKAAINGSAPSLAAVLEQINGSNTPRGLGNMLKAYRKRVSGGRMLDHDNKKIPKWHLAKATQ